MAPHTTNNLPPKLYRGLNAFPWQLAHKCLSVRCKYINHKKENCLCQRIFITLLGNLTSVTKALTPLSATKCNSASHSRSDFFFFVNSVTSDMHPTTSLHLYIHSSATVACVRYLH